MFISRRSFLHAGAVCALCAAAPTGTFAFRRQKEHAGASWPRPEGYPIPREAMLDPLYHMDKSSFDPYLNTEFRIRAANGDLVPLVLVEVSDLERDPAKRENVRWGKRGFSLLFAGSRGRLMPQRSYEVEHDGLGSLTLFLVPVFPTDDKTYHYEAIINRI